MSDPNGVLRRLDAPPDDLLSCPAEALLQRLGGPSLRLTGDFFELVDGSVRLTRPVTPAMYTTDPRVVRQDCLCYFMEPMSSVEPERRWSA